MVAAVARETTTTKKTTKGKVSGIDDGNGNVDDGNCNDKERFW